MTTNALFIANLLASIFYVIVQNFFSQLINNSILFLIIILFIYTLEKIKFLNDNNPFIISRFIILLACITLISTLFAQPENSYLYRSLLLAVIIVTEAYELVWNRKKKL